MQRSWLARWAMQPAADVTLAVAVAVIGLVGTAAVSSGTGAGRAWLAYPLIGLGASALVVRRRLPRAVLAVTAGVLVAVFALGVDHDGPFVMLPVMVALYTAAAGGLRRAALSASAGLLAGVVAFSLTGPYAAGLDTAVLLWVSGWTAAAVVTGEVARSRRRYLAEVEARMLAAERTREEEARRRAGEERIRIARELHDVLAHHISMINVQAGVAAHLQEQDPARTQAALLAIKTASRDALRELRATLGVLGDVDEDAPRAPAPGLALLDEVVAAAEAAGLQVDVRVTGEPRALPDAVDLAAFRIVQEAITNAVRHADARSVAVHIGYDDALTLTVDDDGHGAAHDQHVTRGTGILGMRERVTALGGELTAMTRTEGGFRVHAVVPLNGRA